MRHRQYRIVSALDRLPYAFVDLLTRLAKRSVARSGHRYLLLIEDLGDARVGDQVAGASREECAQVLEAAARMHARFWGGAELEPLQWLAGQTVNPRMRHRMYRESRPSFEARHAGRMPDVARRVLEYLDARGVELIRALHRDAPETLIHCDLRFDNVFFDGARAGSPVIFADWQLVGRGAAAYDVAYFLSGALSADAPAELETDLLRGYHRALVRAGAPAYDFERLRRDYQRGLVAVFQILATTDQMDLGDARGARLMDAWVARALSRLAGVDLGALL
jgi:Ser/Thr protein kinase RdoA (MazF antagonist)